MTFDYKSKRFIENANFDTVLCENFIELKKQFLPLKNKYFGSIYYILNHILLIQGVENSNVKCFKVKHSDIRLEEILENIKEGNTGLEGSEIKLKMVSAELAMSLLHNLNESGLHDFSIQIRDVDTYRIIKLPVNTFDNNIQVIGDFLMANQESHSVEFYICKTFDNIQDSDSIIEFVREFFSFYNCLCIQSLFTGHESLNLDKIVGDVVDEISLNGLNKEALENFCKDFDMEIYRLLYNRIFGKLGHNQATGTLLTVLKNLILRHRYLKFEYEWVYKVSNSYLRFLAKKMCYDLNYSDLSLEEISCIKENLRDFKKVEETVKWMVDKRQVRE